MMTRDEFYELTDYRSLERSDKAMAGKASKLAQ
jgi:hypothetical protein